MADSYLERTVTSAESLTKLTFSVWVKRSELGRTQRIVSSSLSNYMTYWRFSSGDNLELWTQDGSGNSAFSFVSNKVFRDINAWYNIVMSVDTTQSTEADRLKIWVNGVQETSWSQSDYPAQNETIGLFGSTSSVVQIGRYSDNSDEFFNGSLSHLAIATGYAYTNTDFGSFDSTSGIWKFKSPSLANWGTNGVHLKFENSGALGTDSSGNSNTYTVNGNLKQSIDTPSNVFATLNSLNTSNSSNTFANGNTKTTVSGSWLGISSTIAVNKGKFYWEIQNSGGGNFGSGIGKVGVNGTSTSYFSTGNNWLFDQSTNYGYYRNGSGTVKANNNSTTTYGTTVASGDILMLAWDADNGKLFTGRNGTWFDSSDPANGTSPMYEPTIGTDFWVPIFVAENNNILVNFGTGYFGTTVVASAGTSSSGDDSVWEYDCPTGYYGLNTKNLNTYG